MYRRGYLSIGKKNLWDFVIRDRDGNDGVTVPIADIAYSWKHRLQENTFELGWQDNIARRVGGIGRHVSAKLLQDPLAPSNLKKGLAPTNKDQKIWGDAYDKEYNGLKDLDMLTEISEVEYQRLVKTYGDEAAAIPTMNIFTVKEDKENIPVRAKSTNVVLGNHEKRIWSRENRYAPVLSAASSRLLTSMAVQEGRVSNKEITRTLSVNLNCRKTNYVS